MREPIRGHFYRHCR